MTQKWPHENQDVVARKIAMWILACAEYLMLFAYGWRRTNDAAHSESAWQSPSGHPKHPNRYGRTHAINSTRYYLHNRSTKRQRNGGRFNNNAR